MYLLALPVGIAWPRHDIDNFKLTEVKVITKLNQCVGCSTMELATRIRYVFNIMFNKKKDNIINYVTAGFQVLSLMSAAGSGGAGLTTDYHPFFLLSLGKIGRRKTRGITLT